jgi:uncharacterized membrane protein
MDKKQSSSTGLAVISLIVILVIGAIYWFSGGVAASKTLTNSILKDYKYLGAVLTIVLIVVVGFMLNRMQRSRH